MSHLTELDRQRIEHGLRQGMSYQQFAQEIGKSRTTIAREVLKHRWPNEKGASERTSNRFFIGVIVMALVSGKAMQKKM